MLYTYNECSFIRQFYPSEEKTKESLKKSPHHLDITAVLNRLTVSHWLLSSLASISGQSNQVPWPAASLLTAL